MIFVGEMIMFIEIWIVYIFEKGHEWEKCLTCKQMAHDMANRCDVQTSFIWKKIKIKFLK